ncbi:MAG TPA: TRAP transporter substrate-binding protein [Stellaceae bacterium]|nr:TRAP transporter substrate-binding protein [Stellaceae bacterium]
MSITLRRAGLSLVTMLAITLASAPASAADYVLRFASLFSPNAPVQQDVLVPWAQQIEKDSTGRIHIDLEPLGTFGKPVDYARMVEKGDVEIAYTVQGYTPGVFPETTVMELPMLYPDSVTGTKALWRLYDEGLLAKDYANVKVLGLFVLPPYGIFTVDRNVTSLRDLRGLRVRTPSATVGLALQRLGTIPIGLPVDVLGENISNGLVDAVAFGWDTPRSTAGFGDKKTLEQQVKYMVDANFAAPALMMAMNKAKYEAMPEDLRKIIDAHSGHDFSMNFAKYRDEHEAAAKKRLAQDPTHVVIELSPEQREEMRKLVAPVVNDWAAGLKKQGIDADKLLARARELVSAANTN